MCVCLPKTSVYFCNTFFNFYESCKNQSHYSSRFHFKHHFSTALRLARSSRSTSSIVVIASVCRMPSGIKRPQLHPLPSIGFAVGWCNIQKQYFPDSIATSGDAGSMFSYRNELVAWIAQRLLNGQCRLLLSITLMLLGPCVILGSLDRLVVRPTNSQLSTISHDGGGTYRKEHREYKQTLFP